MVKTGGFLDKSHDRLINIFLVCDQSSDYISGRCDPKFLKSMASVPRSVSFTTENIDYKKKVKNREFTHFWLKIDFEELVEFGF